MPPPPAETDARAWGQAEPTPRDPVEGAPRGASDVSPSQDRGASSREVTTAPPGAVEGRRGHPSGSPPGVGASSPDGDAALAQVVRRHGARPDALIEVLHQVQELHGYLPPTALRQVAVALRLPLSRVYGVASFYQLFRLDPPTAHRCAVCLGTACFVRGGAHLAQRLEQRLGVRLDDGAGNGIWALQHVSCLGACGQAPVIVVDGRLVTRLPVDDSPELERRFDAAGLPAQSITG